MAQARRSLIRTIAGKLRPLAGSLKLGQTVKMGYMAQEQELLNPNFTALQSVQDVSSFNETRGTQLPALLPVQRR
jgi:ATPase subunit of ABC transporter with duplicated ATPase domains